MKPFFISAPHSGEQIPSEVDWLDGLAEPIVMCDVDRYVDQFYSPFCISHNVKFVSTPWHRYVVDLNRLPEDVDQNSVIGHENPPGTHTTGLHWVKTTKGDVLMSRPIGLDLHKLLVKKYFLGFHEQVAGCYQRYLSDYKNVYQLDAHSMPSQGVSGGAHRDPGQQRAQVVISDQDGKSCSSLYRDLVVQSYEKAGFQVKLNWPYKGGRVTQAYGRPDRGQHCIQVELNRGLYMDEITKKKVEAPPMFQETQEKVGQALALIYRGIDELPL